MQLTFIKNNQQLIESMIKSGEFDKLMKMLKAVNTDATKLPEFLKNLLKYLPKPPKMNKILMTTVAYLMALMGLFSFGNIFLRLRTNRKLAKLKKLNGKKMKIGGGKGLTILFGTLGVGSIIGSVLMFLFVL